MYTGNVDCHVYHCGLNEHSSCFVDSNTVLKSVDYWHCWSASAHSKHKESIKAIQCQRHCVQSSTHTELMWSSQSGPHQTGIPRAPQVRMSYGVTKGCHRDQGCVSFLIITGSCGWNRSETRRFVVACHLPDSWSQSTIYQIHMHVQRFMIQDPCSHRNQN